jgi:hypothetical protein
MPSDHHQVQASGDGTVITHETPLPEVARLMGAATAMMVDRQEYQLQILVLIAARAYMVHLQFSVESGVDFDPIIFQEKVHKFVDCFLLAYKGERLA